MSAMDFLDKLLVRYASTFDLHRPYTLNGIEYPAYGYFFSHIEKYILVREANMWSADSFEHVLFRTFDTIKLCDVKAAEDIVKNNMEPELVRKGAKYPDKNHMYSYLTFVFLSEGSVSKDVIKAVKHYRFEKGYQFNIRGYSQGRMVLVDLASNRVYFNYQGRKMKKLFLSVINDFEQS